jgi:predicted branched-subunit amino acid permease
MNVNTVNHTYAPTVFAVAVLIAAIAVMAGNWLLVVAVVCALLAAARLARHHPSRRNRRLH